jgi:hypothetical protein
MSPTVQGYVVYRALTAHVFGLSVICDGLYVSEFNCKVCICVYSVSACLVLLAVLLVC